MNRSLLFFFLLAGATVSALACSTTITEVRPSPEGAAAGDGAALPQASADDLGQPCSGFGTSPGDTALFEDEGCNAGSCLVDARETLELYCSADCSKVTCPTGYTCQEVSIPGGTLACFRDAIAAAPEKPDAAPPATNPEGVAYPTDNIGWKVRSGNVRGDRIANLSFSGYAPNTTTLTTIHLADFYDPTGKTHDVVYLLGGSRWDVHTKAGLDTVQEASTFPRIAALAVVGEGTSPGTAATSTDLTSWRASLPWATTALDSAFVTLKPAFDAEAVPLTLIIDARTMEITQGGVGALTLPEMVDEAVSAITSRSPAY